jgi:nitrogen fixation/metabolism regulation signal transduction histidine kinase
MQGLAWDSGELLRPVLDALPFMILVVDEDVLIHAFNAAAAELLGEEPAKALRRRGGEALGCIRSTESPGGCGHGPHCEECVFRQTVQDCHRQEKSIRRRVTLEVVTQGTTKEISTVISATPLRHATGTYVVLVIEDISDLVSLQRTLAICAKCKKIRSDDTAWEQLEGYFLKQWDLNFTHGLCPACCAEEMSTLTPRFAG